MSSFISEIKKIPIDKLIYAFSELSIEMYNNGKSITKSFPIQINRYGFYQIKSIMLTAWDIPSIEYLSVKNSTDYRESNKISAISELVNLYRCYENDLSSKQVGKYPDSNEIFRIVLGMTSEQFQFQNFHLMFEKLNRTYYMLIVAKHYEYANEIDVSDAINKELGFSPEDYLVVLLMVFWLCTQHPDPLNAPEELYRKKVSTVFTKENISKFVKYYSCSYDDLRNSSFQRQLLYSKPFINTSRHDLYLSSSVYMVGFLIGNGLYWLGRDYYKHDGQRFPNAFGNLFEDYIKELASTYCDNGEWKIIPKEKEKGADYSFIFESIQMIVESKSSLLNLDAKQQIPNLNSISSFFERTIQESYEQLKRSYDKYKDDVKTPTIKVMLLYDEFSNTAIIEQSMPEIFENDTSCFVMTIRHLEILLYLHKNDPAKFDIVIEKIIEATTPNSEAMNFDAIFDKLFIYENPHIDDKLDYIKPIMEHFAVNFYKDI